MSMKEGLPVQGYRPQSDEKIASVNANKITEEEILRMIEAQTKSGMLDPRWAAIAKTGFEQAWMALNRAVFQPSRASLPGDKTIEKYLERKPAQDMNEQLPMEKEQP